MEVDSHRFAFACRNTSSSNSRDDQLLDRSNSHHLIVIGIKKTEDFQHDVTGLSVNLFDVTLSARFLCHNFSDIVGNGDS
jgi:hypothetical protein